MVPLARQDQMVRSISGTRTRTTGLRDIHLLGHPFQLLLSIWMGRCLLMRSAMIGIRDMRSIVHSTLIRLCCTRLRQMIASRGLLSRQLVGGDDVIRGVWECKAKVMESAWCYGISTWSESEWEVIGKDWIIKW